MTRRYDDFLKDIADCARRIGEFIEGYSYEQFESDEKTVFAVVRAFEVIGEATKNIPEEIRVRYPAIEWNRMATMRNKLIHEYFGADLTIVWETAQKDVPILKEQIQKVINDLKSE